MRILAALFLLMSMAANAATVTIAKRERLDARTLDPDKIVTRTGNPTQDEIDRLKTGQIDLLVFTSTAQVLEDATSSFDDCAAALSLVGTTVEQPPVEARFRAGEFCNGKLQRGFVWIAP